MSSLIAVSLLAGVLGTMWQSTRATRAERAHLEESTKRTASDATLNRQHAARVSWIPSIQCLRDADQRFEALKLVQQAKAVLPDDPIVTELFGELSATVSIATNPSDAEVAIRDWQTVESDWRSLGRTPISAAVLPQGPVRFRFSQNGYVAVERLIDVSPEMVIYHQLHDDDKLPKGMLFVPEKKAGPFTGIKKDVDAFFADKYEVTNRQFKRFVEAGGYETAEYWKLEFQEEGPMISWHDAMNKFRDQTGQPGPATWVNGQYPDGEENFPVRGVSWYEAAAYAEFANKSLPTIHHWAAAASLDQAQYIAPLGNFSGIGPAEVGNYSGITGFGLYDMAGNVKEWCWNETESGGRWIRGGSWREPTYMFGVWDAASPFSRTPDFGFRCVRYVKPPSANLLAASPQTNFAYKPIKPATTEERELYRRQYLFEKERPLNATIVSIDDSNEGYRHKLVEVDTPYANERLSIHMLYPRDTERPLSPILYYPGAGAKTVRSLAESGRYFDLRFVLGLVRGGRVVCWPVYHGTFNRKLAEPPYGSIQWRDLEVRRTKDLIRAVDYLETQPDLDTSNLAFVGFSWGGGQGPLVAVVEPRLRLCVFACGGLFPYGGILAPEINPYNFAPAVKVPVLMINGRFDQFFPMVPSQIPLFDRLGSDDKEHHHFDSGHGTPEAPTIQRVNEWLDRHSDATSPDVTAPAIGPAAGIYEGSQRRPELGERPAEGRDVDEAS